MITRRFTSTRLTPARLSLALRGARSARPVTADGLKTRADYRFLPGMSFGWTWDFAGAIKINDTVHALHRRQHASVRAAWLGHRGVAIGTDQPARRGGAESESIA